MRRRYYALIALLGLVAAGAVSATVVLLVGGGGGGLTRAEYLARVNAVCQEYGRRLDRVPPPGDIAAPGAIVESVSRALPILQEQAAKVREIEPPQDFEAGVDRFLALTDASIAALREALSAARRRDLNGSATALGRFFVTRDAARETGRALGFRCERRPTASEYRASLGAICREYRDRLAKISSPATFADPELVVESVDTALPLLLEQAAEVRAIEPPPELRPRVDRFLELTDRSLADLRAIRRAARAQDLRAVELALARFIAVREEAQVEAEAIGFTC